MCRRVFAVLLALALAAPVAAPRAHGARTYVSSVGPIAMTVADADRSAAFYSDVLGFEKVSETEVVVSRGIGCTGSPSPGCASCSCGWATSASSSWNSSLPADGRFPRTRAAMTAGSSMSRSLSARWTVRMRSCKAPASYTFRPAHSGSPDWNPKAGGIRAFYFKDPDGHVLEILWFPPGKGATKWRRTDALFLGIDHTAIVVGDTARSLRCYCDTLGLVVAGESENWGPEQERLNDVVGARLRITTLRAAEGPGIEMLEYLSPRDGRPGSDDTGANDLVHWHTGLVTPDAAGLERALRGSVCGAAAASTVIVPAGHDMGFTRAFLARDPDAHALQVTQR